MYINGAACYPLIILSSCLNGTSSFGGKRVRKEKIDRLRFVFRGKSSSFDLVLDGVGGENDLSRFY